MNMFTFGDYESYNHVLTVRLNILFCLRILMASVTVVASPSAITPMITPMIIIPFLPLLLLVVLVVAPIRIKNS